MIDRDTKTEPSAAIDLGAFVRGSAHEFANPLNAITMHAELAKSLFARDLPARAAEAIDRLLANCTTCGQLLQSFRRFGAGLRAQPSERASVRAIVDAAVSIAAAERSRPPAVQIEGADLWTHVDRQALERALAELLFNAADAQADTVRISIRQEGSDVVIDFADNGIGIKPELRGKMTDAFFSTHRNLGNAGLGLNLLQEVLNANGGALHVGSQAADARGMCMRVHLPLCNA